MSGLGWRWQRDPLGIHCDLSTGLLIDFNFHRSQEDKNKIWGSKLKHGPTNVSDIRVQILKYRHLPETAA